MFRDLLMTELVAFTQGANHLIYLLQKLPVVGKRISDMWYQQTDIKKAFGILVWIFKTIGNLFLKALYIVIMIWAPASLYVAKINPDISEQAGYLYLFFWLNLLFGSVINSTIFDKHEKDYVMLHKMHVNAKRYYLGNIGKKICMESLVYLIGFLCLGFGVKSLYFIVVCAGARFLGEMISVLLYLQSGRISDKFFTVCRVVYGIIILFCAFGLPFVYADAVRVCEGQKFRLALLIFVAGGIGAFCYLIRFKRFGYIAKKTVTLEATLAGEDLKATMITADIQLEDKQSLEIIREDQFAHLSGYEYLNALFFYRHQRLVRKAVRIRVVVIGLLFLISYVVLAFVSQELRDEAAKEVAELIPLLVFIMYVLSTGPRLCKAMFFNCDMSLLKYGYYRKPEAVLKNYRLRLRKVIWYNLLPAFLIAGGMVLFYIFSGNAGNMLNIVPFVICTISLAIFFSVFNLFLYYILQPYTEEMEMKNPVFKFINGAMYLFCYVCMQVTTGNIVFAGIIIVVTLLFSIIASRLIYVIAPKTFRLK